MEMTTLTARVSVACWRGSASTVLADVSICCRQVETACHTKLLYAAMIYKWIVVVALAGVHGHCQQHLLWITWQGEDSNSISALGIGQ